MAPVVTLAALIEPQEHEPTKRVLRPIEPVDLPELTNLYRHAYAAGNPHGDTEKAANRIHTIFEGVHGIPIPQACLLTTNEAGDITAAIVTTDRSLHNGTQTAVIVELFTQPDQRKQGLAEELLSHAMNALHRLGHNAVAVTVDSSNAAALALYLSRDFRRTAPGEEFPIH